ncbi:hypothetical protein [Maridesulfovibrio sp.]|uniref:hypothetical protein n=1 Tax=Maridesulfovibrio sp. TaxID=2795000 RepID=UPI0029CA574F|nr:hypothetical protein [Maridesulfovibrio sp.]
MKDLLTFVGGVAVGILAAAGIYAAVDDESDMTCRNAHTDSEEMEDQDEESVNDGADELLEPDGS